MDSMNYKTVKKTYKSYCDALKRLEDRGFTSFSRVGSGYTHYLGEEFSCNSSNYKEADNVRVDIADIFDFGRPKIIEPSFWIYKSSFFKISFSSTELYKTYSLDRKKIVEADHILEINFGDKGYGLGYWKEAKKSISEIADQCKIDVKNRLNEYLIDADKVLQTWIEGHKKTQQDLKIISI